GRDGALEPGRPEEPEEEGRVDLPQLRGPVRIPGLDREHDRAEDAVDHEALQLLELALLEPEVAHGGHLRRVDGGLGGIRVLGLLRGRDAVQGRLDLQADLAGHLGRTLDRGLVQPLGVEAVVEVLDRDGDAHGERPTEQEQRLDVQATDLRQAPDNGFTYYSHFSKGLVSLSLAGEDNSLAGEDHLSPSGPRYPRVWVRRSS